MGDRAEMRTIQLCVYMYIIPCLSSIHPRVEEEAFEAAALIIILRLWRVVRIVNGAVLSSKAQSDRQLEEARAEARKIIHAFHKCQDKLDEMEVKITIHCCRVG